MGRSPKDIEDQITYPLSIALQAVPGSKSVRGKSMFGFSFVQVTFDDDVDFYWARSRVAEQLTTVSGSLPEDVTPTLGARCDRTGSDLLLRPSAARRAWTLPSFDRSRISSSSIRCSPWKVSPKLRRLAATYGNTRSKSIRTSCAITTFRLARSSKPSKRPTLTSVQRRLKPAAWSSSSAAKGFIGSGKTEPETIDQIKNTVVITRRGVPVRVGDLAQVQTGPAFRRGALDFNGQEAVGGVVVMRYGENPREVIERVKGQGGFSRVGTGRNQDPRYLRPHCADR